MWDRKGLLAFVVLILESTFFVSCTAVASITSPSQPTPLSSVRAPLSIERLAVLRESSGGAAAYARLESTAFHLKDRRPALQIEDPMNLPTLLREQCLQGTGAIADESAIRVGGVLGVDSVLLYRIDGLPGDITFAPVAGRSGQP